MVKRKKKIPRVGKTRTPLPNSGRLKERLMELSADQLIDIVEKFVSQLGEKQKLEFMNLLPAVKAEDLESMLAYDRGEDFITEINDFCGRVGNEEFVEYGAGFDPAEGEYHGFGDDSWIEEMESLFEGAESYYLARRYETAAKAYQLLFDCLEMESDGGFYFTTSDPQSALDTDLMKARKNYFDSLLHLYKEQTLAEQILNGLEKYRYISEKPPELKEIFPANREIIQLLEQALIKMPSRDNPDTGLSFLTQPAELLRQIYKDFRNLEELDKFAQQYGKKHPWCYEDLVRAYAQKKNWQQVLFWAEQGLSTKTSRKTERNAILAEYKAKAAAQLGDPLAVLSACWDAFTNGPDTDRYLALRKAAHTQGKWHEYYPRLIERLTPKVTGNSVLVSDMQDNRLLVEVLLVEGEYDRALAQGTQSRLSSSWDEKANAPKLLVDFFLHSITRSLDKITCASQYKEISRRLDKPPKLIKQMKEELFQEKLLESERNKQIDWITQIIKPAIDHIVTSKSQMSYADAAHDARLLENLYRFQAQPEKAQSFIMGLHTQYQRHRNFRAELKKIGLE